MRLSWRSEIRRESTPKTVAEPRVGERMFISTLIVVVLPAPFAPINAYALLWGTEKLSPRRASCRPKFFQRSFTWII